MRQPGLNLQTKIILLSTIIMGVLFVALTIVVMVLFSSGLRQGTDLLLRQDMNTIIELLTLNNDGNIGLFTLKPIDDDETVRDIRFQVRDPGGAILIASGNLRNTPLPLNTAVGAYADNVHFSDITIGGEVIRTLTRIHKLRNRRQQRYVAVHVIRSIDPFARQEQRLRRILLWLLPFPLLLTVIGTWWVAAHTLRPVNRMIAAVNDIEAKDLHNRLPVLRADEVGRLAQTFNRLLARLERAFNTLKQFTADASHELRGSLAVIRNRGEVILNRSRSSDDYRNGIGGMLEEVGHLEQLTNSLLELARADAGIIKPAWERIPLSDIVNDWLDRYTPMIADKSLRLQRDVDEDVVIEADRNIAERIIVNLLDNAVKYSPAGGNIVVQLKRADDEIRLAIADDGPGIPESERERIFERFVRLDQARKREDGAGLGLALVKWAVELHHGSIEYRQGRSPGACFVVHLPCKQPAANAS